MGKLVLDENGLLITTKDCLRGNIPWKIPHRFRSIEELVDHLIVLYENHLRCFLLSIGDNDDGFAFHTLGITDHFVETDITLYDWLIVIDTKIVKQQFMRKDLDRFADPNPFIQLKIEGHDESIKKIHKMFMDYISKYLVV